MDLGRGHHLALADALARLPTPEGARSVALYRHGTLEVKLYTPRGTDPQTPHARDEIYVVAAGSGTFLCDGTSAPFATGDFLFAPAGVAHRFEGFTDDFAVWVFYYGPDGGERAESDGA